MSKYYAVKNGLKPGIYRSWKECQVQINGFSGALYKSFKNEQDALDYINPPSVEIKTYDMTVDIYTDGSHQTSKNYLGLGAWCVFNGIEYRMSKECNMKMLRTYGITSTKCSNPTAEFLGFSECLREFESMQLVKSCKLNFYIDYIGVKYWIEGSWKTKEIYIKKIKEECKKLMKSMSCDVEIFHVKGHTGNHGNEMADECATDMNEYNDFSSLRAAIESK